MALWNKALIVRNMQMHIRPHYSICHTSPNTWNSSLQPSPWKRLGTTLREALQPESYISLNVSFVQLSFCNSTHRSSSRKQAAHSFIHGVSSTYSPLLSPTAALLCPYHFSTKSDRMYMYHKRFSTTASVPLCWDALFDSTYLWQIALCVLGYTCRAI